MLLGHAFPVRTKVGSWCRGEKNLRGYSGLWLSSGQRMNRYTVSVGSKCRGEAMLFWLSVDTHLISSLEAFKS